MTTATELILRLTAVTRRRYYVTALFFLGLELHYSFTKTVTCLRMGTSKLGLLRIDEKVCLYAHRSSL